MALVLLRMGEAPFSWTLVFAGAVLTAAGEAIRLAAVHHIGVISRTRSDRLGPLITSGPFAIVRNPLYVGNILLWTGFAVTARLLWAAPIIAALLLLEYHLIVAWEESLLDAHYGPAYRNYAAAVPRWLPSPRISNRGTASETVAFSWPETMFSERGTLLAIAAGYLLLWIAKG